MYKLDFFDEKRLKHVFKVVNFHTPITSDIKKKSKLQQLQNMQNELLSTGFEVTCIMPPFFKE